MDSPLSGTIWELILKQAEEACDEFNSSIRKPKAHMKHSFAWGKYGAAVSLLVSAKDLISEDHLPHVVARLEHISTKVGVQTKETGGMWQDCQTLAKSAIRDITGAGGE